MKCKTIIKRSSLIIPIVCGILLGIVDDIRLNYYVVMSLLSLCSYIILINFPVLSKFMHRKPIYFEDLHDADLLDHYQRIFIRTINVPLALFVSFLSGYFIYRIKSTSLTYFEIIGVVGGNISVYNNLQKRAGQILIDILHYKLHTAKSRRMSDAPDTTTCANVV